MMRLTINRIDFIKKSNQTEIFSLFLPNDGSFEDETGQIHIGIYDDKIAASMPRIN